MRNPTSAPAPVRRAKRSDSPPRLQEMVPVDPVFGQSWALDALQPGAVLEVLSTGRFSWWELPAWLEMNGHALLEQEKGWWKLRRSYHFLVR